MSSIPPFIAISRHYLLAGEAQQNAGRSLEGWGHAGLLFAFCALLGASGLLGA